MQVGYIFQCAFELESWTDIAVVLVPSINFLKTEEQEHQEEFVD